MSNRFQRNSFQTPITSQQVDSVAEKLANHKDLHAKMAAEWPDNCNINYTTCLAWCAVCFARARPVQPSRGLLKHPHRERDNHHHHSGRRQQHQPGAICGGKKASWAAARMGSSLPLFPWTFFPAYLKVGLCWNCECCPTWTFDASVPRVFHSLCRLVLTPHPACIMQHSFNVQHVMSPFLQTRAAATLED